MMFFSFRSADVYFVPSIERTLLFFYFPDGGFAREGRYYFLN